MGTVLPKCNYNLQRHPLIHTEKNQTQGPIRPLSGGLALRCLAVPYYDRTSQGSFHG